MATESTFTPMQIEEYRGVTGLVVAEVTKDDSTGYTTGEVVQLAGVASITKSTSSSSESHYYNNLPAITINATGGDTINVEISALSLDRSALITGQKYNSSTDSLVEGDPVKKYFALGYKTQKTNGEEIYVWRYKGSFAVPEEEHQTKNAGTDGKGQKLVFTGISTTHSFDGFGQVKSLYVNATSGKSDVSKFFDTVTTPDQLTAVNVTG